MTTTMDIHDEYILYITPEKFYIEATNSNELLVIDRVSQDMLLQGKHVQIPQSSSSKPICGIIGIIRLIAGPYLIVVTRKWKVGTINNQDIWRIDECEVIPFSRTLLHLTEKQTAENQQYVSMVDHVLKTPHLYFSYSYDLTHTLQRLHNTTPEFLQMPLHERADPRFVWNSNLLREMATRQELHRFCLPIVHGFISVNHCSLNGKPFLWTLVSRRSCYRAGTRLFTRGVDFQGSVANFVETEQIIEYGGDRSSFVQIRGSIPLFWTQLPNLKYKPRPRLVPTENHAEAFARHIETQVFNYGRIVLVNLIDHRGAEDVLEKAFREHVTRLGNSNVRYEAFDFHAECRALRWDRLSILLDRLSHEQDEFGVFLLTRDGTLVSQQDGVFRTNCVDCLDRTNVVQSMLARRSLTQVLQKLGLLQQSQAVQQQPLLEYLFKQVWADNADVLSIQYSGTGALKTDFTRTGKRTRIGLLRDLVNSLTRYCKNNFADGFRQDAIDLFLGRYQVQDGEGAAQPCPLETEKGWKYITFPVVLMVAIAMFFANIITPTEYNTESLLYLLFWASMVSVTSMIIMIYGTEFVDYPKLCELRGSSALSLE
ncbi:phosphatidylinositol-3-phosphatase SAC1 [Schistocerca nitens]|uniref:phosphatidylinositol-3-phosphatase SAC1 n=1 Tax=Schistocerca nitens TaxID=7011 RepID=UPI0021185FED|nr:phosphatidylinositol-3-phosphatase SAC1 [Schistocerca nitens]